MRARNAVFGACQLAQLQPAVASPANCSGGNRAHPEKDEYDQTVRNDFKPADMVRCLRRIAKVLAALGHQARHSQISPVDSFTSESVAEWPVFFLGSAEETVLLEQHHNVATALENRTKEPAR